MDSNVVFLMPHITSIMDVLTIPLNKWNAFREKLAEMACEEIANGIINRLQIDPIVWNRMMIYLKDYLTEGGTDVPDDLVSSLENVKKYLKENNVPPTKWIDVIMEMDRQIRPIVTNVPLRVLVPLVQKELEKENKK